MSTVGLVMPGQRLESDDDTGAVRRGYVVVLSGDRMGETFALGDRTAIGRALSADIRIGDEGISRNHALIEADSGVYYLSDAGSTNGTYANGQKVDRYPLREGDRIQIGAVTVLKFTYHEDLDEDLQRRLYESALRDRLTSVFNRGYFDNRLESDVAFALRHGKPLSLVMLEVDDVERLFEVAGQDGVDEVLAALAKRVQATTRSEDILARFSSATFCIICRDVDALRGSRAAYRLLETISSRPFDPGGRRVTVTVSIGVSDLGIVHQPTAKALVDASDAALFLAKRNGKNRVEIYDPEQNPTRLV